MGILDLFFPKWCVSCRKLGSYICAQCFTRIIFSDYETCLVCNRPSLTGYTHPTCQNKTIIQGSSTALIYSTIIKKCIYVFKYKPYVSDIQTVLGDLFYESIIQKEAFIKTISHKAILVPIPLHKKRLQERGYNHAELLAKKLSTKLNIPFFPLLNRIKYTVPQKGLQKKERQDNIKKAFQYRGVLKDTTITIILVDDILTTGSTFLEASKTLQKAGFKNVWCIALAKD